MKKIFLLLFAAFSLLQLEAQIRGNEIVVSVAPDRTDYTYQKGEKCWFTVQVLKHNVPQQGVKIDYDMGPEMYETIHKKDVTLKDGTLRLSATMQQPGFYRLKVKTTIGGKTYEGLATAGFSPEKISPTAKCPADFDSFWEKTLADARAAATLEPTKTLMPERCTDKVNVYQVSFQNDRWGSRTYGILCVPKAPGKYPAIYKVPGAGIRPYSGDPWEAAKGCIVLEIGIHGIPVDNTQAYYDLLFNGALRDYWNVNNNNPQTFYYKRVVVGAIRGIDYIASLDEWDGKNLGVMGSSQGGFLTLACAALDKRVSCYAPVHAAICDLAASQEGKPCGWPHYFYRQQQPDTKELNCVSYYDGVNFAKRITVPGWFSFGYNDEVVPPTTSWATYNVVSATKEIHPYPQTGHYWYQEQYDEWIAWLEKQLGMNK